MLCRCLRTDCSLLLIKLPILPFCSWVTFWTITYYYLANHKRALPHKFTQTNAWSRPYPIWAIPIPMAVRNASREGWSLSQLRTQKVNESRWLSGTRISKLPSLKPWLSKSHLQSAPAPSPHNKGALFHTHHIKNTTSPEVRNLS